MKIKIFETEYDTKEGTIDLPGFSLNDYVGEDNVFLITLNNHYGIIDFSIPSFFNCFETNDDLTNYYHYYSSDYNELIDNIKYIEHFIAEYINSIKEELDSYKDLMPEIERYNNIKEII
jgi:hypothetical protein